MSQTEHSVFPTGSLAPSTRDAIVALCTRAFRQDFSSLFDLIALSVDPMHILAYQEGVLIGHACWSTRWLQPGQHVPLRTAYVDAVATDPAHQGRGVGSAVIQRLMAEIQPYDLGGLSTARTSFYRRLGWEQWSGLTAIRTRTGLIDTPDDIVMVLRTPTTPLLDATALLTADGRAGQPW